MALVTPLILAAREMVEADQLRTATNQGVRAASDMVGTDIRIAGERYAVNSTIPLAPIEIIQGSGTDPDEIVLRRNLWEGAFPVCQQVSASTAAIFVLRPTDGSWTPIGAHPECIQTFDANGWPKSMAEVRALADTLTGSPTGILRGYIYDPSSGDDEFFNFRVQNNAKTTFRITVISPNFANVYKLNEFPLIYILEERHYRLQSGNLELVVNDEPALRVAGDMSDFQARYVLSDGTVSETLSGGNTWRDIRSIEITVSAQTAAGAEAVDRSLTYRYFPRNALSR